MVDPVRNQQHGNGDRNDDAVAKEDRAEHEQRDRKLREGEQEVREQSRRDIGAD